MSGENGVFFFQVFNLKTHERVLVSSRSFHCALEPANGDRLAQGRLFILDSYVCFYSDVFGSVHKRVFFLDEIAEVRPSRLSIASIHRRACERVRLSYLSHLSNWRLSDIMTLTQVHRANTAAVVPNAIKIVRKDGRVETFTSFADREEAFSALCAAVDRTSSSTKADERISGPIPSSTAPMMS